MSRSKINKLIETKRLTKAQIIGRIEKFFNEHPTQIYNFKQVARGIDVKTEPGKIEVMHILMQMKYDLFLTETDPGRFRRNPKNDVREGIFERKGHGEHYVKIGGEGTPVLVKEENSLHALTGDRVQYVLLKKRHQHEMEAKVTEILERAEHTFVGVLEVKKHYAFLATNNRVLSNDIYVPLDKLNGAHDGDKAIVKINDWSPSSSNPEGEVVDILGRPGENNAEMHAILAEFGLPYRYPQNVEEAADKISDVIPPDEIVRREDFRRINTFTIDPKDAKDFDDALSIRLMDNGNW
ncbi:MAG: ribonuclease R, partial [Bacteroidales bacterium]